MTKILVFTRLPNEDFWTYTGDCFDASEADEVCESLKRTVRDGDLYLRIETWPDDEVKDLCKGRRQRRDRS